MNDLIEYLDQNRQRHVDQLCEWLAMASISTGPAYADEVQRAANWLGDRFTSMGLHTEVIPTIGHPIVYAETPPVPGAPTVLVYGHYDVQPPDPLDLWDTPPFEPSIRDGKVFARGASDDKGQALTHVLAVEAWLATRGELPVQVKFLIEGEEESGSHGLYDFLAGDGDGGAAIRKKLNSQIAVISDTTQYAPNQPAITYGLRGIACYELILEGPNRDLHSGAYGGSVANPAQALATMLGSLIDDQGRIQVPGFYDDVIPPTEAERAMLEQLDFDEQAYADELGVRQLFGEAGWSTLEQRWVRPSLDINGLTSGYQGKGSKTVLPSRASAKLSLRLVANQDPERIARSLREKLESICPAGIRMTWIDSHGSPGFALSLDNPYLQAASRAIECGFGRAPVMIRSGGSIPIVNTIRQDLGIDTLLLGWGQDDDNLHSPNEKFSLEDFYRGTRSSIFLWHELATSSGHGA